MNIHSIGIDLGKTTFHLVALDEHGRTVIKKKFSGPQLLAYTANLPIALVGLEACSGAHFVGAALREQGHDVLLYENIEGGHGAAADNKQAAFMDALAFSFLWKELKK